MNALIVQKYGQTVLQTGEMIVDDTQEAARQGEDNQYQTAEPQVNSDYFDGTKEWADSSAKR